MRGWIARTPQKAYEYWEQHLFNYNNRTDLSWPTFPLYSTDGIHFLMEYYEVHVELTCGRNQNNEWTPRDTLIEDYIEWTTENFDNHSHFVEAVVLFGHASNALNADYFYALRDLLTDPLYSDIPVLFLEDNHWLNVEGRFLGLPNLLQIEQDDTVTPMKITVNSSADGLHNVFQFDRGCLCSTDHRPTRLIKYGSLHPCKGKCKKEFRACQGESVWY